MGQDKALMPFLGVPLLERVIERVASLGDELFITTNNPGNYQGFGVPLYRDVQPGKGALGGLLTALSAAQYPNLIVVACDMPFVNPELLESALSVLQNQDADVVIPHAEKGYEPFHAVYRRDSCLPAVQTALDSGERRLISWFPGVDVISINETDMLKFDPHQVAFWNVNTQEDLTRAEKFALEFNL